MFQSIMSALPDWAVALLLMMLVWFGINYLIISDYYWDGLLADKCRGQLVVERDANRLDMALHTASFGLVRRESEIIGKICRGS
jgi:hypothetical protein